MLQCLSYVAWPDASETQKVGTCEGVSLQSPEFQTCALGFTHKDLSPLALLQRDKQLNCFSLIHEVYFFFGFVAMVKDQTSKTRSLQMMHGQSDK